MESSVGRAPNSASMRSYSGVQRSGMISFTGGEDRAQAHAASAGLKPQGADLDRTEQRPQLPRPLMLQRPLPPTSRAASPGLAVLLGLRLNKVALQAGQDRLGLC